MNEFKFRAPTMEEHENPVTPKHTIDETFNRPMFQGKSRLGGTRVKGEPRAAWLHDHHLTIHSHPADWLDAMLPTYTVLHKKSLTPHELSIEKLCKWSNEKALLMGMGTPFMYPTFVQFTPQEFEQYLYLFFWNGLNPSP